jgi:hypothetical protein
MHLAYIDGGTGSMALQVLLAGALSAVYAFHTSWAAIKNKFMKKGRHGSNSSGQ